MPAVLKRTLFVGLGGTGAAAVLHTKKRFLDTYGEIPPMIDFLVIDTDRNISGKSLERENVLEDHKNKMPYVNFLKSEFIHSVVVGAREIYERYKDSVYNWFPAENVHVLKDMATGAGQVRSNGRFSVFHNHQSITDSIRSKINGIKHIKIDENGRFRFKGQGVEVNIVFSVAGGTGSGSVLDVSYLIKAALSGMHGVKTTGYLVLPDVFNAMASGISMANTEPNTFGALIELDYFMQNRINRKGQGLQITFPNNHISIESNPFDILFGINNTNKNGQTINQIEAVAEQVALALFTGASELSDNVDSVFDNVSGVLAGGSLDIDDKRAWACGMGASELFYDGNTLGNIFASKVSASMIDSLLNTTVDAQTLANSFVDRDDVRIREDEGNNHLIDSLLSEDPNIAFHIDDSKNAANEAKSFLDNVESTGKSEIAEKYAKLTFNVIEALSREIRKIINKDGGVGNAVSFLQDLKSLIGLFNEEMRQEQKEFRFELANLQNQISADANYLKKLLESNLSFLKQGEVRNIRESIESTVGRKARVIHELLRREYAQLFFNKLVEITNEKSEHVSTVRQRLERVKNKVISNSNNLSVAANNRDKIFVVDLHKGELNTIFVKKDIFSIHEFVDTLNPHNNIYEFHQSTEEKQSNNIFGNTQKSYLKRELMLISQ